RALSALTLILILLGGCVSAPPPVAAPVAVEAPFLVQPERMAAKRVAALAGPVDLVFIGDSITQNYDRVSEKVEENYKPVWDAFYGSRHALNLGYGMDTSAATLWRFAHGELDGIAPKLAVILIGTNDTNLGHSARETFSDVEVVVNAAHERMPHARLLLIGILPSDKSTAKSKADAEVNALLAARYTASEFVTFIDIASVFRKEGQLDRSLYVEKGPHEALHPNVSGQAVMARAIEPTVARLLGEPSLK
ncbi:MAG: GDSL-type esterase/lipase family protein, partial [Parvibaculum sedimenti]|uniref:GDSL-type esterase/lipase family protein n=1 Tax=Parvibaculum sedimenti TaxID=2608632 RepID=UPI003BB6C1F3